MTNVIITGAKGRMGQALKTCALRHTGLRIIGEIDLGGDLKPFIGQANVVIDFSSHDATAELQTSRHTAQ